MVYLCGLDYAGVGSHKRLEREAHGSVLPYRGTIYGLTEELSPIFQDSTDQLLLKYIVAHYRIRSLVALVK